MQRRTRGIDEHLTLATVNEELDFQVGFGFIHIRALPGILPEPICDGILRLQSRIKVIVEQLGIEDTPNCKRLIHPHEGAPIDIVYPIVDILSIFDRKGSHLEKHPKGGAKGEIGFIQKSFIANAGYGTGMQFDITTTDRPDFIRQDLFQSGISRHHQIQIAHVQDISYEGTEWRGVVRESDQTLGWTSETGPGPFNKHGDQNRIQL